MIEFKCYIYCGRTFNHCFHCSAQDIKAKKHHIPVVDRTPQEPPPVIVAIVGPPKVGKTTLMQSIIKNYTRQRLTNIQVYIFVWK